MNNQRDTGKNWWSIRMNCFYSAKHTRDATSTPMHIPVRAQRRGISIRRTTTVCQKCVLYLCGKCIKLAAYIPCCETRWKKEKKRKRLWNGSTGKRTISAPVRPLARDFICVSSPRSFNLMCNTFSDTALLLFRIIFHFVKVNTLCLRCSLPFHRCFVLRSKHGKHDETLTIPMGKLGQCISRLQDVV